MDLEYYDNLYDEENHLLIKHQHDHTRYTRYQCNICNKLCNKMNMVKCKICLETSNLWISSHHNVFQPVCNYCIKKNDLCTTTKASKFCKKYAIKLNCSSKWCQNSHKLKNQCIYIVRAKKNKLKWKWRSGFYGYKLDEQYVNIIKSTTTTNNYNILPRKIGDDWYRIFCDQCLKDRDLSFSNCNLKSIGNKLLNSMKRDINNQDKYNEYISEQRAILFHSTKQAIKSKFCQDITNIIFEMCIGYDIGAYLMRCIVCSDKNCDILPEIWVFQGIASKPFFFNHLGIRMSYYMVNNEYIEKLLSVKMNKYNKNNIKKNNILNMYGIRLFEGKYYRIFCVMMGHNLVRCAYHQCKNQEIWRLYPEYCWNHKRCFICNNYIISDHDKYDICKYCNNLYHRKQCGDEYNKCCAQCLMKYCGIIKYYNRRHKNGIIQIKGRLNEFSNYDCSLPLINQLIDYNKPTKAQQPLITALRNMFEQFATNDDNAMSIDDMKRYILHCIGKKHIMAKYSSSDDRVKRIFSRFDKSETQLTTKGFINFYSDAILTRPQHVINDLNAFGFKESVLFEAKGKRINASFGDYKYKRRDKHRLVTFEIAINDDGKEYAFNVNNINATK